MIADLLENGPVAVNVGVETFAATLESQGVAVVRVDWAPPPEYEPAIAALLEELG